MFCENCGKEIMQETHYCKYCGYKFNENEIFEKTTNEHIERIEEKELFSANRNNRANKPKSFVIGIIALILIMVGVFVYLNMATTDKEIKGEWELLSDGYNNDRSPWYLTFKNGGKVLVDDEVVAFEHDKEQGYLSIEDKAFDYSTYENILVLKTYDNDLQDYVSAIYVKVDGLDEQEIEECKYYRDNYGDVRADTIQQYIKGSWCSSQNNLYNVEGLDSFAKDYATDFLYDGRDLKYKSDLLPIDKPEMNYYFDGNRLVSDGCNSLMFIPLNSEKMYIYCYSNNKIDTYKEL